MIRKYVYACTAALFLITSVHAQKDPPKLETLKDSASYAMGVSLGQTIARRYPAMDIDIVAKGIKDAFSTTDTLMKPENVNAIINAFAKETSRIAGIKNKEEGEKFLKENAVKEGVLKTESGLQYMILKQGTGPKPVAGSRVKVNYRGSFINGKEFESTYTRSEPTTFDISGVIKGWTEGLMLMPVGSKYKLFVPSELAYGETGRGSLIPPTTVLIFEVELLEIVQ